MKKKFASDDIKTDRDVALIVHPEVAGVGGHGLRLVDTVVEEAEGLARAIDLDTAPSQVLKVARIQPGHFFGSGQIEMVGQIV